MIKEIFKLIGLIITLISMAVAGTVYVNSMVDDKLDKYTPIHSFEIMCRQLDRIEQKLDNIFDDKKCKR